MILLTGGGSFAREFAKQYECAVKSLRTVGVRGLEELLSNVDVIVHNAANINCKNIIDAVEDNFITTKFLIDYVYDQKPSIRFIYLSSMSILDNENEYLRIDDMSPYAYSKYIAETYCLKHPSHETCCVRFSTLFYKDRRRDGLSKLISDACSLNEVTIYNGGSARRDFIPLGIAVQYVHKIIKSEQVERLYTIASGTSISYFEIVEYLRSKYPSLKVVDQKMQLSKDVLHEFSDKSINSLGKISFRLEEEIDSCLTIFRNGSES